MTWDALISGIIRFLREPRAPKRTAADLEIMRLIDGIHTERPFLGARKIRLDLRDLG